MARNDGKAENQHTVPKMLLRNFAFDGRGKQQQIHVFDKRTNAEFTTGISNVSTERRFYDFPGSDESLEPHLNELETRASAALRKLIEGRRLDSLTGGESRWIATFAAVQYLRSKNFRVAAKDVNDQIAEKVRRLRGNPDRVKGWQQFKSDEDVKIFSFASFARLSPELSEAIFAKQWALFETTPEQPFWLSDNPVVMHNDREVGPYGNIGFNAPGIQIYLPVSPTLMLGWWCHTHANMFADAARGGRRALGLALDALRKARRYQRGVDEIVIGAVERAVVGKLDVMLANVEAGRPTTCTASEVVFFNSHQVRWAERQLYSSLPEFALAKKMIADNAKFRHGARMTLS